MACALACAPRGGSWSLPTCLQAHAQNWQRCRHSVNPQDESFLFETATTCPDRLMTSDGSHGCWVSHFFMDNAEQRANWMPRVTFTCIYNAFAFVLWYQRNTCETARGCQTQRWFWLKRPINRDAGRFVKHCGGVEHAVCSPRRLVFAGAGLDT